MNLRNICIIAHVDHGKTTLVDHLLRQAGAFQKHQSVGDRVMDSMDLERERGITILAKNTSVRFKETKINIVDTPGHADFGGEVERILGMVDGALLLVDAAEGPLPQTRFVLEKAIQQGLKLVLVVNKVDRPECQDGLRTQEVVNQAFDLFIELGGDKSQADLPIIYSCAREGWCTSEFKEIPSLIAGSGAGSGAGEKKGSLEPLFQVILEEIPEPKIEDGQGFRMLVSNLSYSEYVGRLAVGRVLSGRIKRGQRILRHGFQGRNEWFTISRLYIFEALNQVEVNEIGAGEIGVIAGSEVIEIGDSVVESDGISPLPRIAVETPTLGMLFSVNTSPLSGKEGEAVQSRKLRDRLLREVRHNVALRLEESPQPDQFRILGRGELQFAILSEQMRREGLEFMIGKPTVLYKRQDDGARLEPFERAVLDLPAVYAGEVTSLFQGRKGLLVKYEPLSGEGERERVRLEIDIPTRGLLGLRSRYLTTTRGEGLMSTRLLGYEPHKGEILHRLNGALVSDRLGDSVEYGLLGLEDRGMLFIGPRMPTYEGMIIGEHAKDNDLNVNPCREKKLTNVRAAHAELLVTLAGIRKMSLEQCIEWIDEDEWIEITPKSIRLRKKVLQANFRSVKRADRVE